MNALFLCNLTDNAMLPWIDAGFRCISVDMQFAETIHIGQVARVKADVKRYVPPFGEYAICMAFPPCTDMAVSGARWFSGKGLDSLADSISVVAACARICEAVGCPYFIEHPVSTLSSYWRKPDYTFDPCDYAGYLENPELEAYTKKTCLWTGGGFVMPEKKRVEPVLGSKMHLLPPSEDRANLRSATPIGFSLAVFQANCPQAVKEAAV